MAEPVIAGRGPKKVTVEAGKDYYWCSCGRSKNQPFCDGSHVGTKFTPIKWTAGESGDKYFCLCKKTGNAPFCDGTHRKLPAETKVADIEDLIKPSASGPSNNGPTPEEPTLALVKELAREGASGHGAMGAMGVPGPTLPRWDDIQFVTAQLATKPLLDDVPVDTRLVLGPRARKPLVFDVPIFVSDMSFGSLSQEAKVALATGAELAGTGICSGEGGMLPAEQAANSKYLYELASAKFGFSDENVAKAQAFHFKGGQAAKTGTGGHLPANKVTKEIAAVRGLEPGKSAISPATFTDLVTVDDFKKVADHVRALTGGIPIGFKISAQHIEADIQFAIAASADYIILDGRGGGTGAAPLLIRDNITVPTIPAIARARRYLDSVGAKDITLIATGGLRVPADFAKAMALGADGVAIANSALQSIGCVAARMCNTNLCPAGIATQDPSLRKLVDIPTASKQLCNFIKGSAQQMSILARACGHKKLAYFNRGDLTTWKKDMAELSGVPFAGASEVPPPIAPATSRVWSAPQLVAEPSKEEVSRGPPPPPPPPLTASRVVTGRPDELQSTAPGAYIVGSRESLLRSYATGRDEERAQVPPLDFGLRRERDPYLSHQRSLEYLRGSDPLGYTDRLFASTGHQSARPFSHGPYSRLPYESLSRSGTPSLQFPGRSDNARYYPGGF